MAVAMPDRKALPDGPLRHLVDAVHKLYTKAGRPGVRQISNAIRDRDDLRDTVSHETVSSILRGDGLPRWTKLECVVRQLSSWAVDSPDPDAEVRRFHRLWLEADDASRVSPAVPAPPATPDPAGARTGRRAGGTPAARAVVFNAPARNSHFIGRQGLLDRMRELLDRGRRRPLVVRGIGGVGKTQLSIEFAHRNAGAYDVVWWVPAEGPVQARAALGALAERLDLARSKDLNQTARAALDALEESRLRWLLIFDNAGDPPDMRSVLPFGGHVLVTTRTLGWSRIGDVVDIDVFDRSESVELLCRRGTGIAPAEADLLAGHLGDLPLALEQVAAVQSATGMSVTDYLRLFAEHVGDLLATKRSREYPVSVFTFVTLAVESLGDRAPAAAQLLNLFAFLGPEPVPASLLRTGRAADIEPPLGRALYQHDFIERVVDPLVRYGVARFEPQGQRVQVHRLVRSVLRERLDPEAAAEIQETTHRLLGAANPGNPDDPRTWSLHADLGSHLIASDAVHSRELSARHAFADQIRYLERRGEYEESRHLGKIAVDAWSRPESEGGLGPEHELTLRAVRELANALRALGSYHDARSVTETALRRLRRSPAYGDDHPSTLDLAGAVGIYLRITGAYRQALQMDRDVVERRRRINGDDDPATLRAVGNLAVSLRMNGMFAEAYSADLQVRDAFTMRHGPDHPRTLLAAANLTKDLYGLGRHHESSELVAQVLPRQVDLHGSTHEYVIWSTRMRIVGLRHTGQRQEAVDLASVHFRNSERIFGHQHENTLLSMVTYANALRAVGDHLGARTIGADALARCRQEFGPHHPVTLAAATNFAIILRAAGDRDEAYLIDRVTVRDLREAVGEAHPYTLAATNGLITDLALRHETASAAGLGRDLLRRARETLGPTHPNTLIFEANVGLDMSTLGMNFAVDGVPGRALEELAGSSTDAPHQGRLECDIEPPES